MATTIAYDADFYVRSLMACSATAWFMYEIVTTLREEIEFVWKSTWGLPKVLYLIARYFGLITSISYTAGAIFSVATVSLEGYAHRTGDRTCYFLTCSSIFALLRCAITDDILILAIMIVVTAVDGLLLLRVMALYALRTRLRLLLKILFVQYILLILSVIQTALQLHAELGDIAACVSWINNEPLMFIVALLPSLLFNVVLFSFIAHALLPFWKRGSWTPLFELFLRDGALYVLIISGTEFLMIITIYAFRNRPGLMLVTTAWLTSVLPIASCRLMLNLRGMLRGPHTHSTTQASGAEPSVIDIHGNRNANGTGFTSQTDEVMLQEMQNGTAERGEQAA